MEKQREKRRQRFLRQVGHSNCEKQEGSVGGIVSRGRLGGVGRRLERLHPLRPHKPRGAWGVLFQEG